MVVRCSITLLIWYMVEDRENVWSTWERQGRSRVSRRSSGAFIPGRAGLTALWYYRHWCFAAHIQYECACVAPQKGECGKKKGKVRKNTVKVHKDVQEYSTDKTCGARELKNARIQEIVSPRWYHLVSVRWYRYWYWKYRRKIRDGTGNYLGMCKIVSPRWYVSVARCMACRACGQHKGTTRECKKKMRAGNL